ncbi:hypothetical protein ACLOJK_017460 [Asimina triloba]
MRCVRVQEAARGREGDAKEKLILEERSIITRKDLKGDPTKICHPEGGEKVAYGFLVREISNLFWQMMGSASGATSSTVKLEELEKRGGGSFIKDEQHKEERTRNQSLLDAGSAKEIIIEDSPQKVVKAAKQRAHDEEKIDAFVAVVAGEAMGVKSTDEGDPKVVTQSLDLVAAEEQTMVEEVECHSNGREVPDPCSEGILNDASRKR